MSSGVVGSPVCKFTRIWVREFNFQEPVALCRARWVQCWKPAQSGAGSGTYLGWSLHRVGLAVGFSWAGRGHCLRLPLVSEGKTKQQKKRKFISIFGKFPQHCLCSWKPTRTTRDLSIFPCNSCGAAGGETSFLCRTWWQQRLNSFCFHSVFFTNLKKKIQRNLNSPPGSKPFPCIIYCPSPQLE